MAAYAGFFELRTPQDLLRKLRHDYQRIAQSPTDTYAAFDFFVTAHHMIDWLPSTWPVPKTQVRRELLLRVCSHIANGAKHFVVDPKRHDSVEDTEAKGAFQRNAFQEEAFDVQRSVVELKGGAALALGNSIEVPELARQVFDFWEKQLGPV